MKRLTLQEQNKLFLESVLQKKAIYGVPKGLANEIVGMIPKEKFYSNTDTFCDIAAASPEFVISICNRLNSYNQETDFTTRVFAITQYASVANMIKQEVEEKGYKITIKISKNILEEDLNMKFDVVVGNPPYQGGTNNGGHSLWQQFVDKSIEIVNDDGYVGMISPIWCGLGTEVKHIKKLNVNGQEIDCKNNTNYDVFYNNKVEHLRIMDTREIREHFPSVGSSFCWYILSKGKDKSPTTISYNGDKFLHTFNQEDMIPAIPTKLSLSLIKKVHRDGCFDITISMETMKQHLESKNALSDAKEGDHIHPVYHSHKIIRYTSKISKDFEKIKVLIPKTSTIDKAFIDKDCNQTHDLGYIVFNTYNEANLFKNYINTKFVKGIMAIFRKERKNQPFEVIPKVDLSRTWTNEELYKHFNLTQDEISYIEASVK